MDPVQSLNLNWRFISGIESEMPVTKTLGNLITILGDFAKLRSASIYFVMSVFLIATTRIPLGGLSWNLMFEYFWEICGVRSSYFEIRQACRVFYRRSKWIYRNVSSVLPKKGTFQTIFFLKKSRNTFYSLFNFIENLKYCKSYSRGRQAADENIIQRMGLACCVTKCTGNHSNYLKQIACQQQQTVRRMKHNFTFISTLPILLQP